MRRRVQSHSFSPFPPSPPTLLLSLITQGWQMVLGCPPLLAPWRWTQPHCQPLPWASSWHALPGSPPWWCVWPPSGWRRRHPLSWRRPGPGPAGWRCGRGRGCRLHGRQCWRSLPACRCCPSGSSARSSEGWEFEKIIWSLLQIFTPDVDSGNLKKEKNPIICYTCSLLFFTLKIWNDLTPCYIFSFFVKMSFHLPYFILFVSYRNLFQFQHIQIIVKLIMTSPCKLTHLLIVIMDQITSSKMVSDPPPPPPPHSIHPNFRLFPSTQLLPTHQHPLIANWGWTNLLIRHTA